jgi:hypothetical protein
LIQKRIESASDEAREVMKRIAEALAANASRVADHLTGIGDFYTNEATAALARFHGSKSKELAAQTQIVLRYRGLASNDAIRQK